MYTITVDDKDLYIPDSEDYQVSSASISVNTDSVAYLDMEIPSTNKGLKEVKQQASIVKVYENDIMRYKMFVDKIDYDFEGTAQIHATSVLAYLNDSLVRPYSTIDTEEGITAPSSVNGYFNWLIEQHNKNIKDTKKFFYVGVNQGASLDHNNYIYRSSTEVPTTSDEIRNKILDTYGAYISLTFNGDQNIVNLYADVHDANEQIIDFGVNLLDLIKTISTEDSYTVVRPSGAVPETENHETALPITISSIPDGVSKWDSDVYKAGDTVYSISGVKQYGYKEYEYSNTDVSSVEYLYQLAVSTLKRLVNPYLTIEVKAVDLALLYMKDYRPMEVGQVVRVRSEPHNVDEYLRISEISIDLLDPSQDSYTLGESYDSLTGQQSSYMQKLNSNINKSFDIVGSSADAANKLANIAKKNADEADKKAEQAKTDAAAADAKADKASQDATAAEEKAEKAKTDAAAAIGSAKDAADKAAAASQKADDNTAKITVVENTIKTISGDTAAAVANAKAAKDAADAANKAAEQAKADASTANTEIGKVQSQVGTINTEISNIKQEATDLRDDLSGQITTVKNTMEADYTRKTELSDTTATLRNEISASAAGVIQTVSQDYATKKELKTTTDATNKNAADLTNAINKFNTDVDNLQGQIDGAIETWFYEVDPTDKNEPAVNWTTDTLKKVHLGDLYYNTVSGYCWRYQLQNGTYSWSRITDVDVTKALKDAAAAQTTANSKKRIFVTTPTPPYDVGDLWAQGSNGDIMRCQTAKTSSQSYAAADWVKASKYTDDSAVTKLSNTVEKTYSTKTEVKQLSDQVSSTVSSLETVRVSAEAAQTSANNAKKAADAAQSAADTAKSNAATAQSKADEAASNLAKAEQNLKTLQSQANATDEQLTAAKAEVEKAKSAAATAQSTANTAKSNAATAQATADTAKANAKTAQDDVNALKNRVTAAETSIKQNSDAITLRATKTEVTSAIDGISVGGRNLFYLTKETPVAKSNEGNSGRNYNSWGSTFGSGGSLTKTADGLKLVFGSNVNVSIQVPLAEFGNVENEEVVTISFTYRGNIHQFGDFYFLQKTGYNIGMVGFPSLNEDGSWHKYSHTFSNSQANIRTCVSCLLFYSNSSYDNSKWVEIKAGTLKLEKGNKPTDWSPAPEDLQNDATTKANNALASAKTYADAQIKVSADSIKSEVSSVKTTADSALSKATSVEQTANGLTTKVITAQSTADTAKANAKTAQDTANAAKSTADSAKSTANTASSNASSALTKANTAASDAATAKSNAATAQSTANTANSTANAAKTATNTLETLIRQSGDGVEVAKKVNGAYTSTKTLMGSDGLYIKDSAGTNLTQVKSNSAIIGKESATHISIKSDGMSINDGSNKNLAGFYDTNISLNNGHFKLSTVSGDKTFSYIDTDGDFYLQSNRDDAFSNRCIVKSNYSPGAGHQINTLDLIASGAKNASNVGLAQISISGDGSDNASNSSIKFYADYIYVNNNQLSDFVVAQGTSNTWYYRKWKSGKAECWHNFTHSTGAWAWWNDKSYLKYGTNQIPNKVLPFKFTSVLYHNTTTGTPSDRTGIGSWVTNERVNTEGTLLIGGFVVTPNGEVVNAANLIIHQYVIGTWK